MFLLVPAHPGFPGQIPQSRKTVVCVCVCVPLSGSYWIHTTSTNKFLHHFVHVTLYTTTFPVYSLLTTSTLY